MANATYPIEIFYDGGCRVCDYEMRGYGRRNPSERFRFVDINAPGFAPEAFGRSQEQLMRRLHVRDAQGRIVEGVDGFVLIWRAFPKGSPYQWLAWAVSLPVVRTVVRRAYAVFARYRHLLPKKKGSNR